MTIERKPFVTYQGEEEIEQQKKEKGEVVTVWLSPEDRIELEAWKKLLQQEKDGTALKQMAYLGSKLLGEEKSKAVLDVVLNNYRKNKRLGIVTFD